MTPAVGDRPAELELCDTHGARFSLAGAPTDVLVVFVPWAFTPVCHGELSRLEALGAGFAAAGCEVVVVSCDSSFSQRVWAEREGFSMRLLSDFWPHGAVARAWGVFDETRGCAVRGSFLVRDGRVAWSVVRGLADGRDIDAHLAAVRA